MLKVIKGNLLDMKEGVICHQVNCQQVAGAGLALQIRKKWDSWYHEFTRYSGRLGHVHFYEADDALWVASLYAQSYYGTSKRHTNYAALGSSLLELRTCLASHTIYFPKGMGCGLGGGDWNIVEQIIEDALPDAIIVNNTKGVSI